MTIYDYGLRNVNKEPQEYKLSHILASYRQGMENSGVTSTSPVSVKNSSIKDGSLDFWVASRYIPYISFFPKIKRRIKLAMKVIRGKADILYYE